MECMCRTRRNHWTLLSLFPHLADPLHPNSVLLAHGPAGLERWSQGYNTFEYRATHRVRSLHRVVRANTLFLVWAL